MPPGRALWSVVLTPTLNPPYRPIRSAPATAASPSPARLAWATTQTPPYLKSTACERLLPYRGNQLDLHRHTERQLSHAHGTASMASPLIQSKDQKLGRRVDHLRLLGEPKSRPN